MKSNVDGIFNFEQISLKVESKARQYDDRTAVGLNGVVSVDMGARSRKIVQEVKILSMTESGLSKFLNKLAGLIDGREHVLTAGDGQIYEHLRVDSIVCGNHVCNGIGVSQAVKITYTQLLYSLGS